MGSSGVGLATAKPAEAGVAAAGTGGLAADYLHVHPRSTVTPSDHNLISWAYDPATPSSNSVPASGTLHLVKLKVPAVTTITNILLHVVTAGTGLTSGQSFAVLYDADGVQRGITADQSTAWASGGGGSGLKTMALTSAYTDAPAGFYYVGFWQTGSANLAFLRAGNAAALNAGLSAPNLRYATANTGLTTTAPNPFGAQTAQAVGWWAALS